MSSDAPAPLPADAPADCPRCLKSPALCVCDQVTSFDNRVELLILQHPQEQDCASTRSDSSRSKSIVCHVMSGIETVSGRR